MAVSFIDKEGNSQQVELNGTELYKEAAHKRVTLRQLVNTKFETQANQPEVFKQMCASAGLRFRKDEETGVPAASLLDIFDGPQAASGSFTNMPSAPDSRILFPAALMEAVENKLNSKEDVATGAFESLVGYSTTIASNKVEQPVLNYAGDKGPEGSQFSRISQNTAPNIMLSLTASDISRRIPVSSIGMEISFEALASNSLDFVALTMARFMKMANYNEWVDQIGKLLSGDPDATVSAMSAGTSALPSVTAQSFDSTITTAGSLTQKAWLKFLYANSMSMTKTHMICDFDTLYAIDNRANRPTVVQNNAMDRLDVPFRVSYPAFNTSVDIVCMPVGTFPANTIMAIDKDYAIAKINSSIADYQAVEDMVIKKSRLIRSDRGFIVYRMFDAAINVMTLTV